MKTINNCQACGKQFSSFNAKPTFCSRHCKDNSQMANVDFDKAKILYESGMSQAEVAQKLGTTQKVIYNLFSRNNYKARVAAKRDQRGENNHMWKGDNATYAAYHYRVESTKGKPRKCEVCGTEDPNRKYEWANLSGHYEDVNDYKRMCRSCHNKYDVLGKNLKHEFCVPPQHKHQRNA